MNKLQFYLAYILFYLPYICVEQVSEVNHGETVFRGLENVQCSVD